MDFSVLELHRMDGAESVALVSGPATLAYVQAAIDAGTIPDSCGFRLEECDCCDAVFDGYLWDSPAADGAPWYDAAQPASGEFLGMMLGDEEGLDTLGAGRTVTDNPVRGGIAGRTREGARTVTFKGTLFATTERGMEYGRRWLAWTLRSLDCAPCSESLSTIWAVRFLAWCEDACEAWRELVNVKLTAGPTFTPASDGAKSDRCTAYVQDVEFSLATTSPFLFGLPDCDEGCEFDLYEGEPASTFGATGATGTTRSFTLAATTETVAAGLWGGLPGDYFDGTGDTGGETSAPGEWEDPLDYDDPGMVVIAYTITPAGSPAMQRVRRIAAVLDVTYESSPHVGPWDVAMAFVDGDGNRLPGFQHGPTVDLPPSNAGAWRAIPGTAQRLVWTIVGDWSEAEVAAMRLTYLVRSRQVITDPYPEGGPTLLTQDHLTIDALDVLAQGYHGAGAPCTCDWCRDWCRYPYSCCSLIPPTASDAVPIFTLDAPDGTDVRVEVVQGIDPGEGGGGGSGCVPPGVEGSAWQCSDDVCAKFNVIGDGEMIVDGRLRLAFPHGAAQGDVTAPLRWPDGCCGDLCVCAAARGRTDEPEPATLVVSWARRYTV